MTVRIIEEGWPAGDWQGTGNGQIVDRSPNCRIDAGEIVAFHMKVPANLVGAGLTGNVSVVQYIDQDAWRYGALNSTPGDMTTGAVVPKESGVTTQVSFIGYKADPNDHSDPHRHDYQITPGQDLYFNVANVDAVSGRVAFTFSCEYRKPHTNVPGKKHGKN